MKRAGVGAEDAGDRVEWKSRTRVADPKIVRRNSEEK